MNYLSEAFKKLDVLDEDVFDVDAKGIRDFEEFRDNDDTDDVITIVDPEAESEEDLSDSYIGKVILDCSVCHTDIYKDKSEVVIDEEQGLANVGEECPYCFSIDGFKVIGEVKPFSETEVETDDDVEVKVDGKEVSNESKPIKESTDLSVTDYEGILKFVTKGVQIDGKISRTIGTGDLEISITPDDDSINKVISAAESIGFNEVDRFIDDSPTQGDSWVVLTKQSREGKCVLAIVFNAEHDYAFVNAGYDEDEDYEYFNESLENVKLDTGDQEIEITAHDKEPALDGDEMIAPLDDDTEAEITSNGDEDSEEDFSEVDVDLDDFSEEEFDNLGESYLKKVYNNVDSYKTVRASSSGNTLKLEGLIKFNSGKTKKTSFVFESSTITKSGKAKFIGENAQISRGKKSFTLTGSLKNNKFIAESLNYNYRAKDAGSGKSTRIYGTVTNKK